MKLQVNFDLLSKISTSKNGMVLDRTIKKAVINILIVQGMLLLFEIAVGYTTEQYLFSLLRTAGLQFALFGGVDIAFSKIQKDLAIKQLKVLARILNTININTNYDLLVQSYKYHTDYKLELEDSKFPQIKQEKYIMIPVYEDGEEKEISVLQEHIVGSESYDLSIGTPNYQKKLKLASNPI